MLYYLVLACVAACSALEPVQVLDRWSGGMKGRITITPPVDLHGWTLHILFDVPVGHFQIWRATVVWQNEREVAVRNVNYDADIRAGSTQTMDFTITADGTEPVGAKYYIEGIHEGPLGEPTTTTSTTHAPTTKTSTTRRPTTTTTQSTTITTTEDNLSWLGVRPLTNVDQGNVTGSEMAYDYHVALGLSILFYDAQRSGKLPNNNPITWRGDSGVDDAVEGHDLTGGWYDAGDDVKFNMPMAWASWVLNYGLLKFPDAYERSEQTAAMCDAVRWPLKYFLKCWLPAEDTLYVQVGDRKTESAYWERPETMDTPHKAYTVTPTCPGSDVSAKMVSAMASGYLVFRDVCGRPILADRLLAASKSLYTFAKKNRGLYSDCVKQADDYYGSTGDEDELATAAVWLYKATGHYTYLAEAIDFYNDGVAWAFDWDDDNVGTALLLYEETSLEVYREDIEGFIDVYNGTSVVTTPCGLTYIDRWGSNKYAANAAFIATAAAANGINPDDMKRYAMSQINYILGDNPYHISYEIGYGDNYPRRPHHMGSSCLVNTTECDVNDPGENPNVLYGALVGGPDDVDGYNDVRSDLHNDVATNYNAGFQGALAGLFHFALDDILPPSPEPVC
uniref:cellulase n=1 Tax=Xylophaga rikuzenica TaxID=2028187 RepID=A0A455XIQ4_9BIVA|nr:GH9 cellulase [Xylophaga rikuzenica]